MTSSSSRRERARFPRAVLEGLPKLKLIVGIVPSIYVVDREYMRERGILYCGTSDPIVVSPSPNVVPGISSTAEMAWALVFAVTKQIGMEDRAIRSGAWGTGFPVGLRGKTLGVAGLGNLGGMMVAPARAFGMEVIAWSQNLTEERTRELGVRRVSKKELLEESDVLGVFLVLSERTRGLFQREDLALMKATAFIVNISRGPIIDESALVEALRSGAIAGAGLDVYDREPLPLDHPLRSLENAVLMPHLGYVSEGVFRDAFSRAPEVIAAFLRGKPIRVIE